MAKTVAPLLSFSAGGSIAKTQVYSTWKGRPYVRRYVVPANPNSQGQQATRGAFKWLMEAWKFWPAAATSAWKSYGDSLQITDRNAFAKANVSNLREATTLDDLVVSPAARSGIVAAAMALTPGANQIEVELTAPVLPIGWAITAAHALAIPQQDPTTDADYQIVYADDDAAPYEITLPGLDAATEYLVGGWFEFTKPDGSVAYGQSIQDTASTS